MEKYVNSTINDSKSGWLSIVNKKNSSNFLDISLTDMSKFDNFIEKFITVKNALRQKYFNSGLNDTTKKIFKNDLDRH